MATTTTNYGFDIPQSTDLVKDGATAIATLGQDIDTAMNTALGTKKAGMVLLQSVAFSAVSSIAFPNSTFNATYDNYKIVFTAKPSGSLDVQYRLRVAGVDNSTSNSYSSQRLAVNSTTVSGQRLTSTLGTVGVFETSTRINTFSLELYQPFVADTTALFSLNQRDTSSGAQIEIYSGFHNQTVSYDSINFIASTGNFTGSMSVYGFNK
jgi:hypothetical protein